VESLNREISRVDFGVHAFDVSSTTDDRDASLHHEGLNPIPFHIESHGTRQFITHFPYLHRTLASGGVAVIDELDMAMHPVVMGEILRWFRDPESNPYNAQLWMSCQSPSLLEDLQKDEIAFCKKDKRGRTDIFSLNDVKAVRREDNFYRKYMGGLYGALPLIG
jgi:AAA15 family ATPase/GTPase